MRAIINIFPGECGAWSVACQWAMDIVSGNGVRRGEFEANRSGAAGCMRVIIRRAYASVAVSGSEPGARARPARRTEAASLRRTNTNEEVEIR